MKNIIIFLFFIYTTCGYTQDNPSFFIQIPDKNNLPVVTHSKTGIRKAYSKTKNSKLNELINSYKVYSCIKVFKSSKKPALQNMYLIECNDIKFMYKLHNRFKQYYPKVEDAQVTLLINPNDFGTVGGHIETQEELNYIRAQEAWDITTGSSNIIIGISDTSVEPLHEDLQNKIQIKFGTNYSTGNQHGSFVSSIAAAETNNNKGMSSIGYESSIYNAVNNWVTGVDTLSLKPGVKVINTSWASSAGSSMYNEIVEDRGVVVVGAAGNGVPVHGSATSLIYPAAFKNVISVSSIAHETAEWTDYWGNTYKTVKDSHEIIFNGQSNVHQHNDSVDVVAPGYGVLMANPKNGTGLTSYVRSGGTSLAAPIVSGTIALMFDVNYCIDPKEVETILKLTAVKIDTLPQNTTQYYGKLGAGKLDAYEAVKMAKDMNDTFGTVEVKNRILYRPWFYKLASSPYEIKMTNNDITGGSKLKFKAKNNIEILSGDYYPNTGGYIDLSVDETLTQNCDPPPSSSSKTEKSKQTNNVDSNIEINSLLVYPNPTKEKLHVVNKEDFNEINISDITGKTIYSVKNINTNISIIDISKLNKGIYFIKTTMKTGEINSKKIIKE